MAKKKKETYAICRDCGTEMVPNGACTMNEIKINGRWYKRRSNGYNGECGDCNVGDGKLHHMGCDMEDCPRCGCQLISCCCDKTHLRKQTKV